MKALYKAKVIKMYYLNPSLIKEIQTQNLHLDLVVFKF